MILFLAANPRDTGRLALDREARSIHVELKRSGYRERFDFVTRWAAEPLDLLRELRALKPTIVHFSGHGDGLAAASPTAGSRDVVAGAPDGGATGGLHFHSASGETQVVTAGAIAHVFGAVSRQVQVVVLNACYSASIADALLAYVDCVVGMSGAIHDDAARSFAIGFYGALGEHESIAAAFAQGKAAIDLSGLLDANQPQLQVRSGFDAAQLVLATTEPSLIDVPCPYPGMRPYAASDTGGFHGRDAEISDLISRLRAGEREIFVIGPSGSGKSSLVTAGLLPRLARGVTGLGSFVIRELRPGEQPTMRLREALETHADEPLVIASRVAELLAHRGRGASLLIVVDQFEELFTLASESERARLFGVLRALRGERRCVVLFTLRADFFGALMESSLWAERRGQLSRVEVSPLRDEALREAIAAPAHAVGVIVEPELIERLVADAASEPGILPLLQESLVQLWDTRTDQTLTLTDYQALSDGERSGLAVALARRANATLRRFSDGQTAIARRILVRLISFGEGRSDTRRQQLRAQLRTAGDDAEDFAFVFQNMVDDRLLTLDEDVAGEPRVDLAHEIMISAWPTLVDWIQNHRIDEQRRRKLETAAHQHIRGERGLLDRIELTNAEVWQKTESAVRIGQSDAVTAFIAASRAQRTRQRVVWSMFVAAVLLFGAFWTVQIVRARNHADAARADAERRSEELTLARAREAIDLDPTRAVAMVKPLVAKHWRDARAIGDAARARGVAWSYPFTGALQSLTIGHSGSHALLANDGALRLHDLVVHTTRTIAQLDAPMPAALTADERWIVAWHDRRLVIVDAAIGDKRELALPTAAIALEIAASTAYWIDERQTVWQLDVVAGHPTTLPAEEPISQLWPSPDGRWLALAGKQHLWLYDRTRPGEPAINAIGGVAHQIGWAPDSSRLIALIDRFGLKLDEITITPEGPEVQYNRPVADPPELIGHRGDQAYGARSGRVWILPMTEEEDQCTVIHSHVSGYAVGMANARGRAFVIGATDGITVTSRSGDHELPLQGGNVLGIVAVPSSPYVIARLEHELLVWNLDDIEPHQLTEAPDGRPVFASAEQVIVSGTTDAPPQTIDIASGDSHSLGDWPTLLSATASADGQSIAVIDAAHHAHIVRRGQPPLDLAGEADIVGFAGDQLAVAGLDGTILVDDLTRRRRTTFAPDGAPLVALGWNRHQPWIAAAYLNGTLWRRQLASGGEATAGREPPRDPAHPVMAYSQLSVGADGSVAFLTGKAVKIWRTDGTLGDLAQLPRPAKALATAGPDHLIAFTDDTLYTIELATGQVSRGIPARGITDAATSAETGLCVVLDHGQLNIIDTLAPPATQRWVLAARGDLSFSEPAISADGRHIVARASRRDDSLLLMWTIDLPDGPDETVRWLNAMTNVGDVVLQPGG